MGSVGIPHPNYPTLAELGRGHPTTMHPTGMIHPYGALAPVLQHFSEFLRIPLGQMRRWSGIVGDITWE